MSTNLPPAITVLMPAYNASSTIGEAVTSVLGQTFPDFEFLILDDGSTDSTAEQAAAFQDPRIRVVRNLKNLGLIATLNKGIELAAGRYLARMDADDISLPERFARQYRLMEESPAVVSCSAWTLDFAPHRLPRYHFREADHASLLARMVVEPPLSHPAAFIRRSTLLEHGLRYDPRYPHCEDYRLWFDLSQVGRLSNVQALLLRARMSESSVSQRHATLQATVARGLRREIIAAFSRRSGLTVEIPERVTAADLRRCQRLYQGIAFRPAAERQGLLRELNCITYCLYMSLAEYTPATLLRFLGSGDWLRFGLRGVRALRIIRKHLRPSHFPALL